MNVSNPTLEILTWLRNTREYTPAPVLDGEVRNILEVARWTGSAMNAQPWELILVRDPATLRALAETSPTLTWLAGAPLAIVLVMAGERATLETFDEGRLAERIMLAAAAQDLGAGLGWINAGEPRARAAALLGVPEGKLLRTVVAVGHMLAEDMPPPEEVATLRGLEPTGDRKPLAGTVFAERYGARADL